MVKPELAEGPDRESGSLGSATLLVGTNFVLFSMVKNRVDYNSYMRGYMLRRYHERMAAAIAFLGGRCRCGSVKDLQFDHTDRTNKSFTVAKLWSLSKAKFWAEVSKCQLLCAMCHKQKTLKDLRQISAKTRHGTISTYRYCRCSLCREAKSAYMRQWRQTR